MIIMRKIKVKKKMKSNQRRIKVEKVEKVERVGLVE
jgi:hypothetical protein